MEENALNMEEQPVEEEENCGGCAEGIIVVLQCTIIILIFTLFLQIYAHGLLL